MMQADQTSENSAFIILMTSDKWSASQPWQREYQHFKESKSLGGLRHFLLIQLSGDPADHYAEFSSAYPCLPH